MGKGEGKRKKGDTTIKEVKPQLEEESDDGEDKEAPMVLTREERRKVKKARKKAKRLAEEAAPAGGNGSRAETKDAGSDGGEWEHVSKKKKRKSDSKDAPEADAANNKKRKRVDADAEQADGNKSGPLQLTWTTPKPRPPLTVAQVRELVLHLLGGESQPSWVRAQGQTPPITVVVFADYLGHDMYNTEPELFPFLSTLKRDSAVLRAPGTQLELFSMAADLCTCSDKNKTPVKPNTQLSKEKKAKTNGQEKDSPQADVMFPSDILLSDEELMENKYPYCGHTEENETEPCPSNYKRSRQFVLRAEGKEASAEENNGVGKMLALDCEMCTTENGLELTRISLVDEKCKVVYDTFVMPDNEILDYNTRFSGITAETLVGVTTTLAQVQNKLLELLSEDTILVGHSLENDLRACQLLHTRIIDTAIIYPHQRGPPYKNALRYLVSKFLRREMQRTSGHCSVDDASACMQLVKLKLARGPLFGASGDSTLSGQSLLARLQRQCKPSRTSIILADAAFSAALSGGNSAAVVRCSDDAAVRKETVQAVKAGEHALVISRFGGLVPPPAPHSTTSAPTTDAAATTPSKAATPELPKVQTIKTLGTGMSFCAGAPAPAANKSASKELASNGKGLAGGDTPTGDKTNASLKRKALVSESEEEEEEEGKEKEKDEKTAQTHQNIFHKQTTVLPSPPDITKKEGLVARKKEVDEHVRKICKQLPVNGLCVVLGTSADLTAIAEMRVRRRNAASGKGAGLPWSEIDEKKLQSSVDAARNGLLCFYVKQA